MRTIWSIVGVLPLAMGLLSPPAKQASTADFTSKIFANLKGRCGSCHGGEHPSANLNLTTLEGFRKGGVSGPLWEPGKPQNSLLVHRLRGRGGLAQMPMGFAPLSDAEIGAIESWISAGAQLPVALKKHWAYQTPKFQGFPKIKRTQWVRNPVDRFILSKLEGLNLPPSPEASRESLLRRVYLDLLGIPPTQKQKEAFLADKRTDAYERVVDSLLENPHYGERQARLWLDLAHYADTNGYEADRSRVMWPYRDWIIRAFNDNMPYDQFSKEQIAGDLMPNASTSQLIATGFFRNSMTNEEGGVDPDEAMYNVINERVATTSTVWLGSTMQCARCHDHKYDPFTQKDYFQLYAYFASNDYSKQGDAKIGQLKYSEPMLTVRPPELVARVQRLKAQIEELDRQIIERSRKEDSFVRRWTDPSRDLPGWVTTDDGVFRSDPPVTWSLNSGVVGVSGDNPNQVTYRWTQSAGRLKSVSGLIFEVHPVDGLVGKGPGRSSSGNFILSELRFKVDGKTVRPKHLLADFVQSGYDLQQCFDGNSETGWAIAPQQGKPHQLVAWLESPIPVSSGSKLEIELVFGSKQWIQHAPARFWFGVTDHAFPGLQLLLPKLGNPQAANRFEEAARLLSAYDPKEQKTHQKLSSLKDDLAKTEKSFPTTLVMADRKGVVNFQAPMRSRGEFMSPAEMVSSAPPGFLENRNGSKSGNRLALAEWLFSPDHPLTARTQVNRMWEQLFGRGIVETVEDFGTQGSIPTHPALLDYLALRFQKSGWNLKQMYRLIVTSATYRQSSKVSPMLLERDPANALLARGPRFRLDAEAIRDSALSISGLLDPTIGGPSVFPPQPDGIWDSPYSGETWVASKGSSQYRRGIYTFWKRTAAYPSFITFDAPSREDCTPRRLRTNTPLQALTLMNDPVYWQAAASLAKRCYREEGKNEERAISLMFELATSRIPSRKELNELLGLLRASKAKVGTEMSLTLVANTILNLDEVITKS